MGTNNSGIVVGQITDPLSGDNKEIKVSSKFVTKASGSLSTVKSKAEDLKQKAQNVGQKAMDQYNSFTSKSIIKEDTIAGRILGKVDVKDVARFLKSETQNLFGDIKNLNKQQIAEIQNEVNKTEEEKAKFFNQIFSIITEQTNLKNNIDKVKILKILNEIKKIKFHKIKIKSTIVPGFEAEIPKNEVRQSQSVNEKITVLTANGNFDSSGKLIDLDPVAQQEFKLNQINEALAQDRNLISLKAGQRVQGLTVFIPSPFYITIKDYYTDSFTNLPLGVAAEILNSESTLVEARYGKDLIIPYFPKARTNLNGEATLLIPYPFSILTENDDDEIPPQPLVDFSTFANDTPTNYTDEQVSEDFQNYIKVVVTPPTGLIPPTNKEDFYIIRKENNKAGVFKKTLQIDCIDSQLVDVGTEYGIIQRARNIKKRRANLNELGRDGLKSLINTRIKDIKNRLLPAILRQGIQFGMNQLYQFATNKVNTLNKVCPPEEKLNDLIAARNKFTLALKVIYNTVKALNVVLVGSKVVISVVSAAIAALTAIQLIGFSKEPVTQARIIAQNKLGNARNRIATLSNDLIQLQVLIRTTLDMLQVIDLAIEQCGGDAIEPSQAELELLRITQDTDSQGELTTSVNGFSLSVEQDNSASFGSTNLKRRRAIGQDKSGNIALRGESSFSASDQVLVDELAFYITVNNLRGD